MPYWSLVLGRRHLERALRENVAHYNAKRLHRGIDLREPESPPDPPHRFPVSGACEEGDVLGGLIHEYELVA
jgi:putative transposase